MPLTPELDSIASIVALLWVILFALMLLTGAAGYRSRDDKPHPPATGAGKYTGRAAQSRSSIHVI